MGSVRSALLPLNFTLNMPEEEQVVRDTEARPLWQPSQGARSFISHCCPRFIPSTRGSRLLFVAAHESPIRALEPSLASEPQVLQRRLAVANLPTGSVVKSDSDFQASWLNGLTGGILRSPHRVHPPPILVDVGMHSLPNAPVHGCPEFVPSLYITPKSMTDTMMEHLKKLRDNLLNGKREEKPQLEKYKLRDTFVFTSNTIASRSVLGVDAQVVAASLNDGGAGGQVSNAHLLYNVDAMPDSITNGLNQRVDKKMDEETQLLRLEGCKPIRAAGRKGHMRMEWVFETLLTTLHIQTQRRTLTTWLACTTADQKVAIVQSPKRQHWVNFSMPFPVYREEAISQNVWCPRGQEDECFEVWSSPNPNEMATEIH